MKNIILSLVVVVIAIAVIVAVFAFKNRDILQKGGEGTSTNAAAVVAPVDHGPIRVSYRKAQMGPGYVLMIQSSGTNSIRVTIEANGKRIEKVIDPQGIWELGHAEGFAFAGNDKAIVTASDFSPREVIIATDKAITADQMPDLPIVITQRAALMGSGQVLTILNKSGDSSLSMEVICERPGTAEKKIFQLTNWSSKEIGHQEGWAFAPGDIVSVSAKGYHTYTSRF